MGAERSKKMTIRIEGWNPEDAQESKATHVDAWYDRHTRLWVVQMLDDNGYQVGDAEYVYGKAAAMAVKAEKENSLK